MVRVVCLTQMPHQSPIHLHLDAVGGVAGDMFVAALLDAAPDLEAELLRALDQAGQVSFVRAHVEIDVGLSKNIIAVQRHLPG